MKTHPVGHQCGDHGPTSATYSNGNESHKRSRHLPLALVALLCFGTPSSFAAVLVDLDASGLSVGPLPIWTNNGSVVGNFTSAGTVVPEVTNVAGVNGVGFIATGGGAGGTHYVGPAAPASVTGGNSRTVEALVYNPSAQGEEVVFGWGRRGGPDGSNLSFNHGTDPNFGAVGHWGAPDIGWNGNITFSNWTHIVYTWDAATRVTRVYRDGQLANSEAGVVLNTWAVDNTTAANPLPFRVARQNAAAGTPSGTGVGEIIISKVRVHDVALSPIQVHEAYCSLFPTTPDCLDDDHDGLPNAYEARFPGCLNPNDGNDANADCDGDGLTNIQEYRRGTNPINPDSDGDGASDGAEVNRVVNGTPAPTDPLNPDSDGDGLKDGVETGTGVYVSPGNTGTDPLKKDTDGDGFVDLHEIVRGTNPNDISSMPNLADPALTALVNLDATTLNPGPLPSWANNGALGGVFVAPGGDVPAVNTIQNIRGVTLNGVADGGQYYTGQDAANQANGPGAPSFLTGTNNHTIEAWIYNPDSVDEETIFAWARRGGPDGSNLSFNHGVNATFGAVGHWGAPDIGWGNAPTGGVAIGRWTYVAYTYRAADGVISVYKDGGLANTKVASPRLNTWEFAGTGARLPFRVGSQNEPDGTPTIGLRGGMTIARLRVYEVAFDANTITNRFAAEADAFGVIDTDNDGLPTWYERLYPACLNPNDPNDADLDCDGDGASNREEFLAGTDPSNPDTDGDGLTDGQELHRMVNGTPAPTNPLRRDTDQDGLPDNVETGTGTYIGPTDTGTDPLAVDSDGDGFADGQEVAHNSDPTDSVNTPDFDFEDPVAIINLDATRLPTGALASWPNTGALGGVFAASGPTPAVTTVNLVKGVTFDGTNFYTGPIAPVYLTGTNSHTVEAWIYNPEVPAEETIFAWARRGGPDGSNMSFIHGTDPTFGAVGHWGEGPDIGWNGNISTGRWTYLAYTYDAATLTQTVYRDGQLANSETNVALNIAAVDTSPQMNPLPFRVATQNDTTGTPTPNLRGTMTIARIRVYDEALTASDIAAKFQAEAETFFPPNTCPTATPSSVTVDQNSSVNFQLQASDAENNSLQYVVTQAPAHGVVVLNVNTGAATYTPGGGYLGPDSFKFKVNDGACDSGEATVSITVRTLNEPPVCVARLACGVSFAGDANVYLIALSGSNACTILDAFPSSDPEGAALGFRWFIQPNPVPFAAGPVATNCFDLGCHTITLAATDSGGATCTTNIDVCVISPCDAIQKCIALIDNSALSRRNKQPLVAGLKAACVNFDIGEFVPAIKQIEAFQRKVAAQLGRSDPATAEAFIACAQAILDGIDCAARLAVDAAQ
jgi:hypothetical protein